MQIRVRVDKEVIILKSEQIGTNNVNTIECSFELCEEFNNLVPVAVFTKDNISYKVNIIDNKCLVPHEVLKSEGEVEFGVYGFVSEGVELVKRYSPVPTVFIVREGSYKEGQESVDASPNSFEFYLSACNNAKSSAETSASNAQTSENNAKISEEKAQTSENNAKTSENNAKTSENNAKASEEKAKNSEANSKISEEKAKQSEENAKLSENNAKESEKEVENIKNSIITEENKRVENEILRQSNEEMRVENEISRANTENERQINEDNRIQNENARIANEETRKNDEEIRVQNESARTVNETTRIVAETNRNDAETVRENNEETRIANEMSREEERKVHNNMLDTLLKDMQIEGADINVKDSADYPCTLNVEGKSEQEVTENSPSSDYPSPIENVSGDLEIKIIGKNTWKQPEDLDLRDVAAGHSNPYKINEILTLYQYGGGATLGTYFKNNSIILNTSKADIVRGKISGLKANTAYTISYLLVTNATKSLYRTLLSNRIIQTAEFNKRLSFVFTTNESGEFGGLTDPSSSMVWLNQDERPQIKYRDIQLEEGDTATEYEKYKEQTVTFPLLEGQKLMKGSYLADDGIHHKRIQVVLNGSENISKRTSSNNSFNLRLAKQSSNGICSNYKSFISPVEIDTKNGIYLLSSSYAIFTDLRFTTLQEFKAYLSEQYANGTPVTFEYSFRNINEEEIEQYTEEQQKAYEQIKALKTYRTVTNISNNQNTNMVLTYKKDLQTQFQEIETMLLESGV